MNIWRGKSFHRGFFLARWHFRPSMALWSALVKLLALLYFARFFFLFVCFFSRHFSLFIYFFFSPFLRSTSFVSFAVEVDVWMEEFSLREVVVGVRTLGATLFITRGCYPAPNMYSQVQQVVGQSSIAPLIKCPNTC